MIDLRDLRKNPEKYRSGAIDKQLDATAVDRLLAMDQQLRQVVSEREQLTAEKNRLSKEIGQLAARLKKDQADDDLADRMAQLQQRPNEIKQREQKLQQQISELEPQRDSAWLAVPQPSDPDVPLGASAAENVPIRTWHPEWFDPNKPFEQNCDFKPKNHIELGQALGMIDFQRGVKMAGSRSYVLKGAGMRLHQAILRYAFDFMVNENGFSPISVPVLVRDELMIGTGFFPHGKDQAYEVRETDRGGGSDLYLTGTGEVGLMGYHQGEVLPMETLPLCYTTVSTCFRREAGAAGKDTKGLFRIHQFEKVEQVVICKNNQAESRAWHQKMIGFVETLLQRLELPYRLLQCCTADLGPKNVDMIDVECWMPSRGPLQEDGTAMGEYAETHSASRLYEYQCRRLNIRYKDPDSKKNVFCHALNNTVAASPRILIPIIELYQCKDGSVTVPKVLRPYLNGLERVEPH